MSHRTPFVLRGLLASASVACTLVAALLVVGGLSIGQSLWYFPGDPPFMDIAVVPALLGFLGSVGSLWLGGHRVLGVRRAVAIASFVICLPPLTVVGSRFSPAWREVRAGIRQYSEQIDAATGGLKRDLSSSEFTELRSRLMATPVSVSLPGYGTVQLRFAHGVYPYVEVKFSEAAHALIDPRTMLCTYSD